MLQLSKRKLSYKDEQNQLVASISLSLVYFLKVLKAAERKGLDLGNS